MRRSDRIMRLIAFYLSLALFIVLLPIILSYSLGYKIDYKDLKVYKTGIIYISSTPAGASIYLNGRLHADVTPAQIEELKPGNYKVEIRREGFYPWERELSVRPNMVTKADRIVLFPVTGDMKIFSEYETGDFTISDKNQIYCFGKTGLFRLNLDGSGFKRLSSYSKWPDGAMKKVFSPDGSKILLYNDRSIWAVHLNSEIPAVMDLESVRVEELYTSDEPVIAVYWYSQSNYLIVVTGKDVRVVELRGGDKRNTVVLYKFNSWPQGVHYDQARDTLYFTDAGKGRSSSGMYLYKLDLRHKFYDSFLQLLLRKEAETHYETR